MRLGGSGRQTRQGSRQSIRFVRLARTDNAIHTGVLGNFRYNAPRVAARLRSVAFEAGGG
jgi:hypothetical protein